MCLCSKQVKTGASVLRLSGFRICDLKSSMAQIDGNLFPSETELWLFGTRLNTNWWDDVSWLTSDGWTGEPQLDHDSRTVLSVQPTLDKAPVLCEFLKDNTATVSSETVRKRFYCKVWRCPKSYSRAEHLRRHINEGVALSRPSDTERTNAWQET